MTALMTLKMAEFAPIPSVRVETAINVKTGVLARVRAANRMSCPVCSNHTTPARRRGLHPAVNVFAVRCLTLELRAFTLLFEETRLLKKRPSPKVLF
jgi:hypothetical protein